MKGKIGCKVDYKWVKQYNKNILMNLPSYFILSYG